VCSVLGRIWKRCILVNFSAVVHTHQLLRSGEGTAFSAMKWYDKETERCSYEDVFIVTFFPQNEKSSKRSRGK
jgi:hypothetical protein